MGWEQRLQGTAGRVGCGAGKKRGPPIVLAGHPTVPARATLRPALCLNRVVRQSRAGLPAALGLFNGSSGVGQVFDGIFAALHLVEPAGGLIRREFFVAEIVVFGGIFLFVGA